MAFYGMARLASRFATRAVRAMARRRPARAFVRRPRIIRRKKTQNKIHSYIRWCDKDTQYPGTNGPNVILETGATHNLAYTFKLDNVVNPSDFTNLYDMYRINKVTLYLEAQNLANANQYASGMPSKKIRVVHDWNDGSPLTQEDDYLEYSNCKSYSSKRSTIAITLYPKINNVVENVGGATNAYTSMNSNKVWLNIAEDEVPHFGLKIFIPSGLCTVNDTPLYRVRAKFHLSFKNSK